MFQRCSEVCEELTRVVVVVDLDLEGADNCLWALLGTMDPSGSMHLATKACWYHFPMATSGLPVSAPLGAELLMVIRKLSDCRSAD